MVAIVCDPKQSLFIDREALRSTELKWFFAAFAKTSQVLSVRGVFVDSVELTILTEYVLACIRSNDIRDEGKLAWVWTVDSTDRFLFHELAVRGVKKKSKIVRISNQYRPIHVDRNTGRFSLFDHGRFPASKIFPVRIEDLNACRLIDYVQLLSARGDGDRSRFLESSFRKTALAYD